jgi:hypothetical protein
LRTLLLLFMVFGIPRLVAGSGSDAIHFLNNFESDKEGDTMKSRMLHLTGFSVLTLVVGLTFATPAAWAGSKIFDPSGNTTATRFSGTVEGNAANNRDPFVVQLFTAGNECLKIAVVSQQQDLEATLVGVEGRVWQDDDGGPGLQPLINAITTVRGWYPLVLHHFAGSFFSTIDFTVDVTRLPSNSPLCQPVTNPSILTSPAAKPAGASSETGPSGGTN